VTLPSNSKILPSELSSTTRTSLPLLEQAIIFATLFRREALRAMEGSQNMLGRASAQLRACLDKVDESLGGAQHDDES
jgi:hypothetical protein